MAAVFQGIGAAAALSPAEKFHSQSRRLVSGSRSFASINWFFDNIFFFLGKLFPGTKQSILHFAEFLVLCFFY